MISLVSRPGPPRIFLATFPDLNMVKQAGRDAGTRADGGLTTAERKELSELCRENRRLREDVEILKRATAFFAKETR